MTKERNLLFGVIAAQLKKVAPADLARTGVAWADDPSTDLADRLAESGALADKDRTLVASVVDQVVTAAEGDERAALASAGGHGEIRAAFRGALQFTGSGEIRAFPENAAMEQAAEVAEGTGGRDAPMARVYPPEAEVRLVLQRYKTLLNGAIVLLALLVCAGVFLQVRVTRQRDTAMEAVAKAESQVAELNASLEEVRAAAEEHREKIEGFEEDLRRAESQREMSHQALAEAQEAREKAEAEVAALKAKQAAVPEAPQPAEMPQAAEVPQAAEAPQAAEEPQAAPPPRPDMEGPPEGEPGSVAPPRPTGTRPEGPPHSGHPDFRLKRPEGPPAEAPTAGKRLPGVTKAQLAAALSKLTNMLKPGETSEGAALIVSSPGGVLPSEVADLGLMDGDAITKVNRDPVTTSAEARQAFDRVKDSSGFSVRVMRDGRSSWMRVNVTTQAAAPQPKAEEAPAPPPPKPETAPGEDEPGDEAGAAQE